MKVVNPWNEANHRSQPTFKNPKRAAQFYNVVRANCRGCKIVAADVIDEVNMERWLKVFKRTAKKPRIWGLHNYRDTNKRRGQRLGGTKRLLKAVKGEVWLTETGGIVKFVLPDGRTLFPQSESRANAATKRMFALAKRYRSRIKRLYIYHWKQSSSDNRFDAGLLRRDGTARPAYSTVRSQLRTRGVQPVGAVDSRRERLRRARLYFVTDVRPGLEELLAAALAGGVDMVQLRDKAASDAELVRAAAVFRRLCDEHGALFWLNDRPDLVAACGADGVHVGQDDMPVADGAPERGAGRARRALDALARAARRGAGGRRGGPAQRGARVGDAHEAGPPGGRARLRAPRRARRGRAPLVRDRRHRPR